MCILYHQYHRCWWLDDARAQVIINSIIDYVSRDVIVSAEEGIKTFNFYAVFMQFRICCVHVATPLWTTANMMTKWKPCLLYWSFVRGIHQSPVFTLTLWWFFDVGSHELEYKQSNDPWFQTTWHLCDVMIAVWFIRSYNITSSVICTFALFKQHLNINI